MAWLKPGQGPAGLPPFAPRPPPVAPPFCSSGRAGSMSSEGALPSHYSTDTQPSSLEEEELSRELTMELLGDFALEEQRSRRGSAHPSRKPSSGPTTSDGAAAGGAAADSPAAAGAQQEGQAGGDLDDEAEPLPEALQPSLYDQLGGGVAVKVRQLSAWAGCLHCQQRHGLNCLVAVLRLLCGGRGRGWWRPPPASWNPPRPALPGTHLHEAHVPVAPASALRSCALHERAYERGPYLPPSPPYPPPSFPPPTRRWWTAFTAACWATRSWAASSREWT